MNENELKPVFSDKELVLKVMDSDFPLQDELIGTIRLPLYALVMIEQWWLARWG